MRVKKHVDRSGHDEYYAGRTSTLIDSASQAEYVRRFAHRQLRPFHLGGPTRGYVRRLATLALIGESRRLERPAQRIRVLDAGCGLGELSVFLACKGFTVIALDVSMEGCRATLALARALGVQERVVVVNGDLAHLPLGQGSIDFIIGYAALHHFIKYPNVPAEFWDVMQPAAQGFFADGYGGNRIYRVFHNRDKMRRLGDQPLTRKAIYHYFEKFELELRPTDWFVMLDKLYSRYLPSDALPFLRRLSQIHFWLDRKIPSSSRIALALSGSVMTRIRKPE